MKNTNGFQRVLVDVNGDTREGWARDEGHQWWVKFDNGACYGIHKDTEKVVLV